MQNRTGRETIRDLSLALERRVLNYTSAEQIIYSIWLYGEKYCGVFGDGDNGAYEWFVWDGKTKTLETSDCGYGAASVALRDALLKAEPVEA